jgi:hypothetical protein
MLHMQKGSAGNRTRTLTSQRKTAEKPPLGIDLGTFGSRVRYPNR